LAVKVRIVTLWCVAVGSVKVWLLVLVTLCYGWVGSDSVWLSRSVMFGSVESCSGLFWLSRLGKVSSVVLWTVLLR